MRTAFLVILAGLGVPLFSVLFAAAWLGYGDAELDRALIFVEIFNRLTDNPLFLTLPLFTLVGTVMTRGGAGERIITLADATVGWIPGGATGVTLLTCAFFTAFTGASGVTIVALGGLLWPLLDRAGVRDGTKLGLLTTGGSLGLLFPPSLPVIVMALVVSGLVPVSVEALFVAAFVPGLLILLVLVVHGAVTAVQSDTSRSPFSWSAAGRALKDAAFDLVTPVLVAGGIFGGVLTTVEAAGCAALYVTLVALVRGLKPSELVAATVEAMGLVGGILIIIMGALALANLLTDQEVPQRILATLKEHIHDELTLLLAINVFLLAVGCMMDIFSAILIVVPLLFPIALGYGVNPVHLAIVVLVNLEIGYSTPPVGINLFIASLRFDRPLSAVYRASLPYIALLLLALGIITYVPWLSLAPLRFYEGTSSTTLTFAVRATKPCDASVTLRFSPREDQDSDPEALEAIATNAPSVAIDVVLERQNISSTETIFTLRRQTDAEKFAIRWRSKSGVNAVLSYAIVPDTQEANEITPRPELFSKPRFEASEDPEGNVTLHLRGVLLWFPEDETKEQVFVDLDVQGTVRPLEPLVAREPAGATSSLVIDGLRRTQRATPSGQIVRIERLRPRPVALRVQWEAQPIPRPLELAIDVEHIEELRGAQLLDWRFAGNEARRLVVLLRSKNGALVDATLDLESP